MTTLLHNHSGHVLTADGLRAAQIAADEAGRAATHTDVDVATMRDGVVGCNVSPSGVLSMGSAASKIREQNSKHSRIDRATIKPPQIKENAMPVIRDRNALVDASASDLLETYEAMTGAPAPANVSVEGLRNMTSMAVLSNIDAAGHLGVQRGAKADPMTHHELESRRRARGVTAAGIDAHGSGGRTSRSSTEGQFPLESNTMATAKKTTTKKTVTAESAVEAKGGRPKTPVTVSVTGNGTTKVRPTSFRGRVLAAIAAKKKISTTELDAQFEKPTLGEVRTLEKLGHVAVVA